MEINRKYEDSKNEGFYLLDATVLSSTTIEEWFIKNIISAIKRII